MNKIYEVTKSKTNIKGFWKDESGKVYIDNIKIYPLSNVLDFESKLFLLFKQGEKAVFCESKDKAFIIDENGGYKTLSNKVKLYRKTLSFNEIKNLLDENGGLTIFKREDYFKIEYWKE